MKHALEFVVLEGAVVQCRGQAKAVLDQGYLPRPVASIHGAHLGDRHVAFVHHQKEIVSEVIEQAEWPLPGLSAVEVTAVVLDSAAEPQFSHHLQVVGGALLKSFAFNEASLFVEPLHLFDHVLLNLPDALMQGVLSRNKEVGWVNAQRLKLVQDLAGFRINGLDAFDLISPEMNAHCMVGIGQENIDHIAVDPERSPAEFAPGAVIKAFNEAVKKGVPADDLARLDFDHAFVKLHRVSNAINAADGGHHDDVPATAQQGRCGRESELFNFLVDGQILFDEGSARGDVGLWLIVVVVADEVLDQVVGKEFLEFTVELRSQGFVVAQHQSGSLRPLNHIGHRERLARACDAKEGLVGHPSVQSFDQLSNGFGLITLGLEFAVKFEAGHLAKSEAQKKGAEPPFLSKHAAVFQILFSDHLKAHFSEDVLVELHLGCVGAEITDGFRAQVDVLAVDDVSKSGHGLCNLDVVDRTKDFSALASLCADFEGQAIDFFCKSL